MSENAIDIGHGLHLSSILETDKAALLEHLGAKEIYNTTLNIPYPYTEADADFWIYKRIEATRRQGVEVTFAIRKSDGQLIGGIGADGLDVAAIPRGNQTFSAPGAHRVEIGYWLAKPFWGQGIMTDAVRAFINYAFSELYLLRLTAHVFEKNIASSRVLEKNGFRLEGHLRRHFFKDGEFIDARIYGLLKEEYQAADLGD